MNATKTPQTVKFWYVCNWQSASRIRCDSQQQAEEYAAREYGHIMSIDTAQRIVWVSEMPRM